MLVSFLLRPTFHDLIASKFLTSNTITSSIQLQHINWGNKNIQTKPGIVICLPPPPHLKDSLSVDTFSGRTVDDSSAQPILIFLISAGPLEEILKGWP